MAWFGIRINTVANSRAAFASLSGNPMNIVNICLRSGMSVGLLLVSIELFFMIIILAYIPKELSGTLHSQPLSRNAQPGAAQYGSD